MDQAWSTLDTQGNKITFVSFVDVSLANCYGPAILRFGQHTVIVEPPVVTIETK